MTEKNQGSFLTGFLAGMLAGAAGLYLFGTDNGKKVRQSLNKEWEEAKIKMADEGIIENSTVSLRQIISSVFEKISENIDESMQSVQKTKNPSKKASATPKAPKGQKFKGV